MILRSWHARAESTKASVYPQHLTESVLPELQKISGFRGAYLLRRPVGPEVEFVVMTLWDSIHAVEEFAGSSPSLAVVEPAARAMLTTFDSTVEHYEVVSAPHG